MRLRLLLAASIALALCVAPWTEARRTVRAAGSATVVISQVYGGGGYSEADGTLLTNQAAASTTATDSNQANNVAAAQTTVQAPDLVLAKSVSPETNVPYHGTVSYTLTLANNGSVAAAGTVLTDSLPAEADFAGWVEQPAGAAFNANTLSWTGAVAAGQTLTYTFTANHNGSYGDVVTNTAEIGHLSGPITATASFSVEPLYDVTFVYHDAEDVLLGGEDVYLAGTFNAWNANVDALTAGPGATTFTTTLALPAGSYAYKYIAKSGGDQWEWLNTDNRQVTVSANTVLHDYRAVRVSAVQLVEPASLATTLGWPTAPLTAQVSITNVTSLVGVGRGVRAEAGYGTSANPDSWAWSTTNYLDEAAGNDRFQGTLLPAAAGVYSYAVRFNGNWGQDNPLAADWAEGDLDGSPFSIGQAGVLTVAQGPQLEVSKLGPAVLYTNETRITYTLAYRNTGDQPAAEVVLTDTLPLGLTPAYITADTSGLPHTDAAGSRRWTVGALAAGTTVTFSVSLTAPVNLGVGTTFTNTASLSTGGPGDGLANNTASVVTTIMAAGPCQGVYTPIYSLQGTAETSPHAGQVRTTHGVVVGDYEGASPALRGFFVQDPAGDGQAASSDGLFVFNGNLNSVSVGDTVGVTGMVNEFQGQTQITASAVEICGTGTVAPVNVTLPLPAADYLERFEGMLVRLPQTLYVTEHFQLSRFGEVVLSANSRLWQPTHVAAPGAAASALQAANNLNQIIVDDATQAQNPDPIAFGRGGLPLSAANTLRGGDTATGLVGVLNYTWGGNAASPNAYRVRPLNTMGGGTPNFQAANARPAAPDAVGGSLRVASLNLLNYFNTFDGLPDTGDNCTAGVDGAAADCRGADTAAEFERQWPKTVAAILALDADIIGLNELENDGYGPQSAVADLVARLNGATAPGTYAFIDADAGTGQLNALGTDTIKVGVIYRPGQVTPVGTTAVLNSAAFVNGGDGQARNRPSLAQAFELNANGAVLIVNTNHFKSKGSPCDMADAGDGQGQCNLVRTNAASALMAWLAGDPTGTGDPDVLLIGDYNAYVMEDPITVFQNAGYANLIEAGLGPNTYSYVFDGQWGYLDHALATDSLASQVTGVTHYHINADEPSVLDYNTNFKSAGQLVSLYSADRYRAADHDPVIVGLELDRPGYSLYLPAFRLSAP